MLISLGILFTFLQFVKEYFGLLFYYGDSLCGTCTCRNSFHRQSFSSSMAIQSFKEPWPLFNLLRLSPVVSSCSPPNLPPPHHYMSFWSFPQSPTFRFSFINLFFYFLFYASKFLQSYNPLTFVGSHYIKFILQFSRFHMSAYLPFTTFILVVLKINH